MERKTKDATDDAMATKCKDPLMLDKRLKNLGFKEFEGGTDHVEFENEMTLAREVNARAICQTGFNTGRVRSRSSVPTKLRASSLLTSVRIVTSKIPGII